MQPVSIRYNLIAGMAAVQPAGNICCVYDGEFPEKNNNCRTTMQYFICATEKLLSCTRLYCKCLFFIVMSHLFPFSNQQIMAYVLVQAIKMCCSSCLLVVFAYDS